MVLHHLQEFCRIVHSRLELLLVLKAVSVVLASKRISMCLPRSGFRLILLRIAALLPVNFFFTRSAWLWPSAKIDTKAQRKEGTKIHIFYYFIALLCVFVPL